MRLFMSENSPYARKVRLVVATLPDARAITQIAVNPREEGTAFRSHAPAARVPLLVLEDGTAIGESDIIAAHLDACLGASRLLAPVFADPARAVLLALANTMLDHGMAARVADAMSNGPDRDAALDKHLAAIRRIGAALNDMAPTVSGTPDYADFALISAIDWTELRHPQLAPKATWPALAAFATYMADRPGVKETRPPG